MNTNSDFLIAATSSGGGKTTLTLGLLRALKNRGTKVQSFKCGPDYIDTKFHTMAGGAKTINLDLFLASEQHLRQLYQKHCSGKDVCITEGVMGLFDGYDRMLGSTAEIANLLDIPVVLVVSAKATAYSVAATLYGFKNFSKNTKVVGAIFNFVASETHYKFLKEACEDVGIEALGYIPKTADIEQPSRHLGLSLENEEEFDAFADRVAAILEKHINIDRLLSITKRERSSAEKMKIEPKNKEFKISIASDKAFNFYYEENLEALKQIGTVSFFSPLSDSKLPPSDFVYLPGGYPELFLKDLSANSSMLCSIREYADRGGRLLAECGGMMYLSSSIADKEGVEYPMVGVFDQKSTMENMKLKLGYRQFKYNDIYFKGHEFHYSRLEGELESATQQYTAKQQPVDTKLLRYKNTIAGYTHLYWAEMDNLMDIF